MTVRSSSIALAHHCSQGCSVFQIELHLWGGSKGLSNDAPGKVLVRAAREERRQHHQVGQRKQPLLRLCASCFRCSCDHAQVTAPREIVQMFHANPRQAGHFHVRENLLTRLDFNHGCLSNSPPLSSPTLFDVHSRLEDAYFPCNSRSVCSRTNHFSSTFFAFRHLCPFLVGISQFGPSSIGHATCLN